MELLPSTVFSQRVRDRRPGNFPGEFDHPNGNFGIMVKRSQKRLIVSRRLAEGRQLAAPIDL